MVTPGRLWRLPILLVIASVAVFVAVGVRLPSLSTETQYIIMVGFPLATVVLTRPQVGLFLLFLLIPFERVISYRILGREVYLWLAMLTFAATGMRILLSRRPNRFVSSVIQWLLGGFVLIVSISYLYAARRDIVLSSISPFLVLLMQSWLVPELFQSVRPVQKALYGMAAAIGVAALAGLMQAAFGWTDNPFSGSDSTFSYLDGSYYLRPGGTFSTFYLLPISVAFLVPVQLAWFSLQTQAGKRLIIVFILVLSATACIIAAERLPIVGMIVGLMLWLIFVIGQERRKSKVNQEGMQWGWVVAAIAIGLAVGVWIFSPELAWTRMLSILEPSQDESLMTRIAIYNSAMSLFFANPILGVGLGQFDFLLPLYGYFQAQGPHSTVLRVLGEHGLIGFLLFYGALLWCLAKAYHAMTYCVQQHIYELSLIAFAVFGSLGVYLFMSLFLEYLSYNRYLGLIIGVGIWLERHVRLLRAERNAAEIK